MVEKKLAYLRKDLYERGLRVPVGEEFHYFSTRPLRFRWYKDEDFQVYYKGKWREAYSIDWNFTENSEAIYN
jgi:hypothetical protein